MKLEKILDGLNSLEKNSFLKIVDGILAEKPRNIKVIDKILTDSSRDLKSIDSINIVKVFHNIEEEFTDYLKNEFSKTNSQLDILIDIISRDGNSIMKQDWFARLYEKEIASLKVKLKAFKAIIDSSDTDIEESRIRDYKIYLNCLNTAFSNDALNNQENKITTDEQSILFTLSRELELSQEEIKLINYLILPIKKLEIDTIINDLKAIGVIFYSRKSNTVYVADEIVKVLRKVRGKEVADKYFRRVLRLLKETQINLICKKHNIDWKLDLDTKIREIINEGISFSSVLVNDIHKTGTKLSDKKKFINDFCDKSLGIVPSLKGVLIEEKISNLIKHFEELELDEKVGISIDGYDKMLLELGEFFPSLNNKIRSEFELQEEKVLNSSYLLDYNIKPRDILDIIADVDLDSFCKQKGIKNRGDKILNVLDAYKDAENLFLENYTDFGFRNFNKLKENGILIKEAEIGLKFEELTRVIFSKLGFNVDEQLRKKINTSKDKMDIIINIGNNDIIIVECKTIKESGYNKFSSVSRQLRSYASTASSNGYKVVKSLLVAPDFSDEFIKDCGLEYELNLSLISASSLIKILEGFKDSKHKVFPHNLLMRDVLIQEDRVIKAIGK